MKLKLFETNTSSYSALILRIALGIMMLPHGLQKLLGIFGGFGFQGTMGYFTETVGIPYFAGLLIILLETLGAMGLILGFLTRFTTAATTLFFLGGIFMEHIQNGFFMNWTGTQSGEGVEFHILAISISISLFLMGGGAYSIDAIISKKMADSF